MRAIRAPFVARFTVALVLAGASLARVSAQEVPGPAPSPSPEVPSPKSSPPAPDTTAPDTTAPETTATATAPVSSATGPGANGDAVGLLPQPPHAASSDDANPVHEAPGFGQDEGESPRIPRIRLELAYLGAAYDSVARIGHTGASNTIDAHEDVHAPRWLSGVRGEVVIKLHPWFAVGAEYLDLEGSGAYRPVKRDVRLGGVVPTEVPRGFRASGVVEFQEAQLSLRLVLADEARFRAEFVLGASWISYRLGVHPGLPLATPPLPGFGQTEGASRRIESFFAPTLGLFFCWNIVDPFAIFIEQHSGYLAVKLGSIESLVRVGARIKVWRGLEIVLGGFLVDGQLYDAQDRYSSRAKGHVYRNVYWLGGGPDVGLSFTY